MAGIAASEPAAPSMPSASSQLTAIAWLRLRLFVNAFRLKGSKGELIARILLLPLFSLLAVGPIVGAGFGGYFIVAKSEWHYLPWLLWIVFFVWQTFAISTQAASPAFDLRMLIRFPLRLSTFILVRLLFGLLDTPTIICTLALLSASIGIGIARPALLPAAVLVLFLLDLTILFFFRMIFLWFDRWFAQRRTREILIGLFFAAMLAFQYVNVTVNLGSSERHNPAARARHAQRVASMKRYAHIAEPILNVLPPGLAATSLTRIAAAQPAQSAPPLLGVCLFGAAFFALYARRIRGEFQGESFNETPAQPNPKALQARLEASAPQTRVPHSSQPHRDEWGLNEASTSIQPTSHPRGILSPITTACIAKELRTLTRSGPFLLQMVSPIFMVFIFVSRSGLSHRPSEWILPSALAYILLGLSVSMFNILGNEGPGVHLYFLAPIHLRDVILAKNLVSLAVIALEVAIATAIVTSTIPSPPLPTLAAIYIWLTLTLTVMLVLGNIRSIYAPRLIDLGKFRQGKQGQLNALIGLAILLTCLALGAGLLYLAHHLSQPWLPAPILAILAAAAITFYRLNLNHLDALARDRRETITAELSRT